MHNRVADTLNLGLIEIDVERQSNHPVGEIFSAI